MSHIIYFIQREVIGFQVLLNSLEPYYTRTSQLSPPVVRVNAVQIIVASAVSGICACMGEMRTIVILLRTCY